MLGDAPTCGLQNNRLTLVIEHRGNPEVNLRYSLDGSSCVSVPYRYKRKAISLLEKRHIVVPRSIICRLGSLHVLYPRVCTCRLEEGTNVVSGRFSFIFPCSIGEA